MVDNFELIKNYIKKQMLGLINDIGKIVHDMANPKKTKVVTEHE